MSSYYIYNSHFYTDIVRPDEEEYNHVGHLRRGDFIIDFEMEKQVSLGNLVANLTSGNFFKVANLTRGLVGFVHSACYWRITESSKKIK